MLNIINIREMQIKITMKHHLVLVRMATIKRQDVTNASEVVEKTNLCTVGGNVNWH